MRFIRDKTAAATTTIQMYWQGYWHRNVVMGQWTYIASMLKDIKIRLEELNYVARPVESLGARIASDIDYIIADVAQLVCAVKSLDMSTRLSFDCCMKMTEGLGGLSLVAQLVSLMTRCNRSVPDMEVKLCSVIKYLL